MSSEDAPPAPARSPAYDRVEGLHLRQWALRPVPLVAALLTNGAGVLDVEWLPRIGHAPTARVQWHTLAAALLVLLATVIRVRAKGVLVRKTQLTAGGIYARCRHPFYLANVLGALGTLLLAGWGGEIAAAAWLIAAYPIYRITISGEEAGLRALYPAEWDAYRRDVPALVPVPWRRGSGPPLEVTWANLVKEREPPRLLRFLGGALLVAGLAQAGRGVLLWTGAAFFAVSYVVPLLTGGGRRSKS